MILFSHRIKFSYKDGSFICSSIYLLIDTLSFYCCHFLIKHENIMNVLLSVFIDPTQEIVHTCVDTGEFLSGTTHSKWSDTQDGPSTVNFRLNGSSAISGTCVNLSIASAHLVVANGDSLNVSISAITLWLTHQVNWCLKVDNSTFASM